MEIDRNIFRAYDIRGIFPKQINTALYEKIGYVIGMNLKTKKTPSIKWIMLNRKVQKI